MHLIWCLIILYNLGENSRKIFGFDVSFDGTEEDSRIARSGLLK